MPPVRVQYLQLKREEIMIYGVSLKFVRWKQLLTKGAKPNKYYYRLLTDAIREKHNTTTSLKRNLKTSTSCLKNDCTWMKFVLIKVSISRLLDAERSKIISIHNEIFNKFFADKLLKDCLLDNPNEIITNLSGRTLRSDKIEILKLKHGIAR